jgi:FKBP-type peptidyl-prolyl cis-trans isomerase 2
MNVNRAKHGDRVRVQYVRLLKDGTATQKHSGRQVLEFFVGSKAVIRGISLGVVGMAHGEEKRLTLEPKDAYGAVRRQLIREFPRERFRTCLDLRVGKRLVSSGATSSRRRVRVVEVRETTVVVDGNHPLAGEVLEVELQLVSLVTPSGSAAGPDNDPDGEG